MIILPSIIIFLCPVPIQSLICPVYNLLNDAGITNSCDRNPLCTYEATKSKNGHCLGIYGFERDLETKQDKIFIRQLGFVDEPEEKYQNETECILNIDVISNNLLCRCHADNCTLKWKIHDKLDIKYRTNPSDKYNYGLLLSAIVIFISMILLISIIIIVMIIKKHNRYRNMNEKDSRSVLASISCTSTNMSNAEIDEFLSSNPTYQSILSHGKSSIIYRAWASENDDTQNEKRLVAVKVYHTQQYRNVCENEVKILKMIHHSSIVGFISHGWHDVSPYILLQYCDLGSLNSYLSTNKLPWSICYSFLVSLLDAVDYLHHEDLSSDCYLSSKRICKPIIIHRDIKSSNVLVKSCPELSLRLCDFGLAKILPPVLMPNDFIQIGTYRYMAPELLELAITHTSDALCKVDMYALGLVMWEIVTQCQDYPYSMEYQLPYAEFVDMNEVDENKILDTLHRIVVHERQRPVLHRTKTMGSTISHVLTIIEDCWKHEPESRINARPALYRLRNLG